MASVVPLEGAWQSTTEFRNFSFRCGFCGDAVGAHRGYQTIHEKREARLGPFTGLPVIIICPSCNGPNHFSGQSWEIQTPAPMLGREIAPLPSDIARLYNEARACTKVSAYTACILTCRKLLMHLAVEHGATPNLPFIKYVEYLADNNWVPPKAKAWVDRIRTTGNEATHEIVLMTAVEATEIMSFVEMMLIFMYEFPARLAVTSEP